MIQDHVPESFIIVLIESSFFMEDNLNCIFVAKFEGFFLDAIFIIFQLSSNIFWFYLNWFAISFDVVVYVA